jgi:hypothetical protein
VFHWKEYVGEPAEVVHYWYVWLGVVQRGDTSKFWLRPVGVTESHGEGRLPPLCGDFWSACCDELFSEDTHAVLLTDSAAAYRERTHVGIVEKHHVNHSEHEYSRSVDIRKDTCCNRCVHHLWCVGFREGGPTSEPDASIICRPFCNCGLSWVTMVRYTCLPWKCLLEYKAIYYVMASLPSETY